MEEKEVLKILTQVNVTKRECEIVCSFLHSLTLNAWQFSRGLNALISLPWSVSMKYTVSGFYFFFRDWSLQTLMRKRKSTRGSR